MPFSWNDPKQYAVETLPDEAVKLKESRKRKGSMGPIPDRLKLRLTGVNFI